MPVDADDFARRALRAVARNRAIVVLPRRATALWYLDRTSPALTGWAASALARRVEKQQIVPSHAAPGDAD